jgi:hypothetical protein
LPDIKIIKTLEVIISLKDIHAYRDLTIETTGGQKITLDSSGIELRNGSSKVKLTSSKVSLNGKGLSLEGM